MADLNWRAGVIILRAWRPLVVKLPKRIRAAELQTTHSHKTVAVKMSSAFSWLECVCVSGGVFSLQ